MNNNDSRSLKKKQPFFLPILGLFLLPLGCMLMARYLDTGVALLSQITDFGIFASALGSVLAGALCLYIHKGWYAGDYEGSLKLRNLGKGLLMLLPFLVVLVGNALAIDFSSLSAENVLAIFVASVAPGFVEEVAFRGLAGANFMRTWRTEKKIVLSATLTSIVFGAAHLGNLSEGAGVIITFSQVIYAMGFGIILSAVFLRTGSLIPSILAHTLVDFTAFMQPAGTEVLTDNGSFNLGMLVSIVIGLVLGALGYYYIRPSKRKEILDLWAKKWHLAPEESETEE